MSYYIVLYNFGCDPQKTESDFAESNIFKIPC